MMIRRYEVHDEDGPLRAFCTRQDALNFMQPGLKLVVLPKHKRKKIDFNQEEEAKW